MGEQMRKAVFLDRDGIINVDGHYVHTVEEFQFVDGIFDFCRKAKEKGYLLIVFTNQSGIARGYYTEEEFMALSDWMCDQFARQGAPIEKVYYCPYHPEKGIGKYHVESYDRKPNPGMLLKARDAYGIDMAESVVLGDKPSDVDAGRNGQVGKLILFPGEYGTSDAEDVITVHSLAEAAQYL